MPRPYCGNRTARQQQLVTGDETHAVICCRQMLDIVLLALAPTSPRAAAARNAVTERLNERRHPRAAGFPNSLQGRQSALVLDRVVQQGRRGFVLITAMFEHGAGHDQQVADVGHVGTLPNLSMVQLHREIERAAELLVQHRIIGLVRHGSTFPSERNGK
jgi:hypothetical protein